MDSETSIIQADNITEFETVAANKPDNPYSILLPFLVVLSSTLVKIVTDLFGDSDHLWSIAIGQWISVHGKIPNVDVFSWTVAGKPCMYSEWLFCWLIYKIDWIVGYMGLDLMVLFAYLITAYFMFALCRHYSKSNLTVWAVAIGMWMLVYHSAMPRAFIFTFAFLAIMMYIIRVKRQSWVIYLLPLLFVLWINIQNSAVYGIVILTVEACAMSYYEKNHRLWPVVALSFLTTLINPYGIAVWTGILDIGTPEFKSIGEWRAPDFNYLQLLGIYLFTWLTGVFATFSKSEQHNKLDILNVGWFWLAFVYALTTVRASHYMIIFWMLLLSAKNPPEFVRQFNLKPLVAVIIFTLYTSFMLWTLPYLGFSHPNWYTMPVGAVDYLKKHPKLQEGLFNSYLYGGYLMNRNIPVFIDARANLYIENGVMQDQLAATSIQTPPESIFNKYKVQTVLLQKDERLAIYLRGRPGWEECYSDNISEIFIRKDKSTK